MREMCFSDHSGSLIHEYIMCLIDHVIPKIDHVIPKLSSCRLLKSDLRMISKLKAVRSLLALSLYFYEDVGW